MPNTPNLALPYPDDEEWLNQGAYAIEQLARAVDTKLTTTHAESSNLAGSVDVPIGQFVNLAEFAYTGDGGWVIVACGASVSTDGGGNYSAKTGRLLHNGAVVASQNTIAIGGAVGLTRIASVAPGDVFTWQVAGGTLDCTASSWWLQVLEVAGHANGLG